MIPAEEQAQRQAAFRALLSKPLLVAPDDAESLLLVRRHLPALAGWLRKETGWRLVADADTARLFKTASRGCDATHPARGQNKEPFSRRRYVALCLALSALARADAQTTLGSLADDVLTAAAEPGLVAAGFTLALDRRSDRADLVAVVRLLLAWGVLSRVAGDEDAYLSAGADVLYDVRRPVLSVLLTGSRGPSTITAGTFGAAIAELTAEPVAETDELRNQVLRRTLTRRLLDEPVVYYDELTEDERAYLVAQRHNITGRIAEATELLPELRAEGVAMVDPDDELTDVRMPEQRTDGHVTLLVAEYLASRARSPRGELLAFVRQAARAHASYWRKGVTDPGAETELLDVALEKLLALRLVGVDIEDTRDGTGSVIRSRPAIARFALAERMEWNLLLGGKHSSPERLGYTWLEFGRRGADGAEEFAAIGCGLKAVAGRGITRHWFFLTTQRPGRELRLLPDSRVPLTREKLREEIGQHGFVYDRAADYRRAVDEHLFGLGPHRYEALVNLLIQLRQPQLSKKPDEKLLSRALTEALPPLSPSLVTTVAEAFHGLDEERDALRSLAEAQQAATDFLGHYRRYAKVAAKRKAAGPRLTHSRYEQLGRDLAAAEEAFTAAQQQLDEAQRELTMLEEQRAELDARRAAVETDPAMRDAERLKQLGEDADRKARAAADRESDRDRHCGQARKHADRAAQAAHQAGARRDKLAQELRDARAAATAARCAGQHGTALATLDAAGDVAPGDGLRDGQGHGQGAYLAAAEAPAADMLAQARRDAQAVVSRQEQAAAQLGKLLEDAAECERDFRSARAEEGRLSADVQAAADRVTAADLAVSERMRLLLDAYRSYLTGLAELRVADPDELIAALEGWGVSGEGGNPAVSIIDDAAREAGAEMGRLAGELGTARTRHVARAGELEQEIGRLRRGGHDAPPVPHTRAAGVRDGRPGAPLWKVTDFVPGLADGERARLEAALEAAGILDAWVTPEGNLVDGDVIVVSGLAPVAGQSCSSVLVPAIDSDDFQAGVLRGESVASVLDAIGLDPVTSRTGGTWVTTDGRWSNGVLSGAWRKDQAGYIGEGAREAARRARVERLERELGAERAAIEGLDEDLAAIGARQERLADEHRGVPPDDGVREAHTKAAGRREQLAQTRANHAEAVTRVRQRHEELSGARVRAAEFAADVGLPADTEELAAVRDGLGGYRVALAALWPAAEAAHTAIRAAADAETEVADSRQLLLEASERAAQAREAASAAATTHAELLATVGTAVEELRRRLAEVAGALDRNKEAHGDARGREQGAFEARGKADGERGRLRTDVEDAMRQRDDAVREFQAFSGTGLLRVAVTSLEIPDAGQPWAATPTVILARAVNAELDSVDDADGPWDRIQKRVTEEHKLLADAMARHGHSAGLTLSEGVIVIDVVFQGRSHDLPGLAEALAAEVEQRTTLLSAREREILENHLLNEVAGTLHELISAAEAEVRQMNDELESRPTSTGMKLRLIWQQARNAPEGLDRVRLKLRQTIDAWSAADRALVGGFLQQRIAAEHADNPASGWTEALSSALDYRDWHEFVIQRYQEGHWRPATGPASGGERALAVSVPLFAAASSHYKSAGNPHAPRLIALDEAFAGVDDDSRAKCLGLLATFDMDVVMTSEREWGCYPQVPGLGICQLARQEGVDAVLVTPWRWDGRERRGVEV